MYFISNSSLIHNGLDVLYYCLLIAVRNGDFTLPYLSSSEIECLVTDIATL